MMKYYQLSCIFMLTLVQITMAQSELHVDGNLLIGVTDTISDADHVLVRLANGVVASTSTKSIHEPESPQPIPMNASYEHYGVGYQDAIFYKQASRVHLDGLLRKTSGNVTNGDTIAVLPISHRPNARIIVFGKQQSYNVRLNIETNGVIHIISGALTGANATFWIGLDGISFYRKENLEIGDYIAGGLVFYVADSPLDLDGDGLLDRGLVAAIVDQSDSMVWGCAGQNIQGAQSFSIGAGWSNTQDIVSDCTESIVAAKICANLDLNGYSDWFLPSFDELTEMLDKIGPNANGDNIGGFSTNGYWASSESPIGAGPDAMMRFPMVGGSNENKTTPGSVRAVRAYR